MGDKCSHLGARLAVLRLRWSHLGANFVYLGAHNGDTTSALPKAIQKYTFKTLSPVALQPRTHEPPLAELYAYIGCLC